MQGTQIQTLKAHLALNVKNVERSIEFYKKMLGIEPCKVRTGYAKFDVLMKRSSESSYLPTPLVQQQINQSHAGR